MEKGFATDVEGNRDFDNVYEICVCCHKKLNITRNEQIEFRPFYIQGAGQLCYDCYYELYLKNNK